MRSTLLTALVVGLAAFAAIPSASAQSHFTAVIDGGQEVPPVPTAQTGSGTFTFDPFTKLLSYNITISGLTGSYVAAHIHTGNVGANGGITFNLSGGPTNFAGTAGPLSAAQENTLKSSGFYVNFHSSTFGSGEVRGQVTPGRTQYIVVCNGAKETPPNASAATGTGTLTMNAAGQVTYDINFSGLTGGFAAAHIHDGAAGVSGGIIVALNQVTPGHLQGTTAALSASQRAKLRAGLTYVNIHSGTFGGGEIRGQVTPSFTDYGTGCAHPGGIATLSGTGVPTANGAITININNGVPSAFGLLYVSIAAFNGNLGFGCPLLVHPALLIPITLPLPPSGSFALPAVLPPTTTPATVNLQYLGDKGGGIPYATNGLQLNLSN